MIVFFLAEDPETGKIIDDCFLSSGGDAPSFFASKKNWDWYAERHSKNICDSHKLRLIDSDGPYSEILWRLGSRQPKWSASRPPSILADKWNTRLKSTDELAIYKMGLRAGRKKGQK
jgi:hypothetical protein